MTEGVGFVPIYRCRGPWVYYVYQIGLLGITRQKVFYLVLF